MKQIWINLPVKDVQKSKTFYKKIGFRSHPMHDSSDHLAGFLIGEQDFVMMLFPEEAFQSFTQHRVSDTSKGSEILINIDAQSRDEVDKMEKTVREAGGEIYASASEVDGWMYVFGFMDPDGHRWSMLYMDQTKMKG